MDFDRFAELWLIFMGALECATETLSLRTYWFVSMPCVFHLLVGVLVIKCQYGLYLQVNPHTHQVKLCDFGSAKVLVVS